MLAGLLLIGCMEYTVDATKDANLGADTADEDLFGDGQTDTTIDEDTGGNEEPTIEESVATEKMYANTSGSLYQVDPETGSMTFIGDFQEDGQPVDRFEDIAIDLSGHMYGGTGEYMYLINPNTAEVRAICPLEIDTTALTFTSDGELIIGVDRALYTFDVVDCSLSILDFKLRIRNSGDIVGLPDGYILVSSRR